MIFKSGELACSIAGEKDIDFGELEKPTTGFGHAHLDVLMDDPEIVAWLGVTSIGGTPTIGTLNVTARNTSTLTVTFDFPRYLTMGDSQSSDPKIRFQGDFSHSTSDSGPWTRGTVVTFTEEEDAIGTHYFQIGGSINVHHDTVPGHYDNTITVTAVCL